jgi:hypothetical protein
MPRPEDIRELTPGEVYRSGDEQTQYWIQGRTVMYGDTAVRLADPDSFRFYLNGFAKDRQHCYCVGVQLRGGSGSTFKAFNNCYATDGRLVWTLGGVVKDADVETFEVCDDGIDYLEHLRAPYGYAKDRARVYHYDYDGKPNWVRKATPDTFHSLNDGHYARDHQFVFYGGSPLPGANPETWHKLDGFYSKDHQRIYYLNRHIKAADYATFEAVPSGIDPCLFARDKNNCYFNDEIVTAEDFAKYFAQIAGKEALLKRTSSD